MTAQSTTPAIRFIIIGLGPRGLMLLERIISFGRKNCRLPVSISIIEPGDPGTGSHPTHQSDHLLLNTVANQLSMFPGEIDSESPAHFGPDFFTWSIAHSRGCERREEEQKILKRLLNPTDFLPRRCLGEYLAWFAEYLFSIIPPSVSVSIHKQLAIDVAPHQSSQTLAVTLEDGKKILADQVFLTIGHSRGASQCAQRAQSISNSLFALNAIRNNSRVCVRGLGLSAMDAVAGIIAEWHGRFEEHEDGRLRYVRSGAEGQITLVTRTGRPYHARPEIAHNQPLRHAQFLKDDLLVELTTGSPPGALDFGATIIPLMKLEMWAAYCQSRELQPRPVQRSGIFTFRSERGNKGTISDSTKVPAGFDSFLDLGAPRGLTQSAYNEWLKNWIDEDVEESRKGLSGSPHKAALEVWRDLREEIRKIVESAALSSSSRNAFFRDYAPMINRLVAGPEWRRSAELSALLESGVVNVIWLGAADCAMSEKDLENVGEFDVILDGRLPSSGVDRTDSPLLERMIDRGIATSCRQFSGTSGLLVNRSGNVLRPNQKPHGNLWAFGPHTEGASYYNHYVPTPGKPSRAYIDAHLAIAKCFENIAASVWGDQIPPL